MHIMQKGREEPIGPHGVAGRDCLVQLVTQQVRYLPCTRSLISPRSSLVLNLPWPVHLEVAAQIKNSWLQHLRSSALNSCRGYLFLLLILFPVTTLCQESWSRNQLYPFFCQANSQLAKLHSHCLTEIMPRG